MFVLLCLNRWVSVFPLLLFNNCVHLQQFVCWPFLVHHLLFCGQVAGRFRFGCCACRDAHSSPVHSTLSGAQVRERYEGCCRRSRKNLTDGIWKMNMFALIHLAPWVWCNSFCVWYQAPPFQSYLLISVDVGGENPFGVKWQFSSRLWKENAGLSYFQVWCFPLQAKQRLQLFCLCA